MNYLNHDPRNVQPSAGVSLGANAAVELRGYTPEEIDRLEQLEVEESLELSRSGLLNFTLNTFPGYQVNWHHRAVCRVLNRFARGEVKRLIINLQPRVGKSELVSRRLPAFLLGRNPKAHIIGACYSADLASRMNRDVQRIIESPAYAKIFPETKLRAEKLVAHSTSWARNSGLFEIVGHGGSYRSVGVGGGLTGMGSNTCVIDDYCKNQEEADSFVYRQRLWEWFGSTLYTRLEKDAGILITACMTGDTRVTMADGTERPLRDIKTGDAIATYENGKVTSSVVENWKSQGIDSVFKIRTTSGITVRANARHPFLVYKNGNLEWLRLKDLRVNDSMICVGGRLEGKNVPPTGAGDQLNARASACPTTIKLDGQRGIDPPLVTPFRAGQQNYGIGTESASRITGPCSSIKGGSALSADSPQLTELTSPKAGIKNSASISTMEPERRVHCYVTSATSSSSADTHAKCCSEPLSTFASTVDTIVEISAVGFDEVFDIQVARTENFIANGLVSHNTRWHEDDLVGRLLAQAEADPSADQWETISFPALAEGDLNTLDQRAPGEALWPEKYDAARLQGIKATVGSRIWSSLYQQRPAPEGGAIVKRNWWKFYTDRPMKFDKVIQAWDLTFTKSATSDYVVGVVLGKIGADIYLLDMVRDRLSFTESIAAMRSMAKKWPDATAKYIEAAANGHALIDTLKHEIAGIIGIPPQGSKVARANAISPRIEAGNVYLPSPSLAPWVGDVVEEWTAFPAGAHDDIVDAMTHGLSKLAGKLEIDFLPISLTQVNAFRY